MFCNSSFFQKKISNDSMPIIIKNNKDNTVLGQHPSDLPASKRNHTYSKTSPVIITDSFLLYFNQTNVAHSICQFIISFYEITQLSKTPNLYVSKCVLQMPFLHKLILLLFNINKVNILDDDTLYICKNVYIPTFIWFYGYETTGFTFDKEFNVNIPTYNKFHEYDTPEFTFDKESNVRIFKSSEIDESKYFNHLTLFQSLIDNIYINNKSKYKTYDNICIIKSQLNSDSTTPQRCMMLSSDVLNTLEKKNYHMILPHQIIDIIQHIVILKSAKNVITSYGGAQCINRFFFTNATVKVICNEHYKYEYKYPWHNKLSQFKSLSTYFFLDIPNNISSEKIEKIINYSL